MQHVVAEEHDVEARIEEWREGRDGKYAKVQILTGTAPTKEAVCTTAVFPLPEPGEIFRCVIRMRSNGAGYEVTDTYVDGLRGRLSNLRATVVGKDGYDLRLEAQRPSGGSTFMVKLPNEILQRASIGDIEPGTEALIDCGRTNDGYRVNKLHSPTVAEAFHQQRNTVTACVSGRWTLNGGKSACVTCKDAGAPVTAKFWIDGGLLKAAGIPRVAPGPKGVIASPEDAENKLNHWETVMRGDSQEEKRNLVIDLLELKLEWLDGHQNYRVNRLLRPRTLREPSRDDEVVDWVAGKVVSVPDTAHVAPEAGGEAPQGKKYHEIDFSSGRVGRGTVRLYEKEDSAAGLSVGATVIFSLRAKRKGGNLFWNLKTLHRSTPVRERGHTQ